MAPLYEFRHSGKSTTVVFMSIAGIVSLLFEPYARSMGDFPLWGQIPALIMPLFVGISFLTQVPVVRVRAYPDHLVISHGFLYMLFFKLPIEEIVGVGSVHFEGKFEKKQWLGWRAFIFSDVEDAVVIATKDDWFLIGCVDAGGVATEIRERVGAKDVQQSVLTGTQVDATLPVRQSRVVTVSPYADTRQPVYEFVNPYRLWRRVVVAVMGLALIAVAVWNPLARIPGIPTGGMSILLRIIIGLLGLLALGFVSQSRLRAFPDRFEIGFGNFFMFRYRIPLEKIVSIEVVRYNPNDLREAFLHGGPGERLHGLTKIIPFEGHRFVAVKTSGGGYLIACPDPDEALTELRKAAKL